MNNITSNQSTYWRPCIDGICYCDWRLTITNCYAQDIFLYINIVIIGLTSCIILIGLGLLYHRLVNLKQIIFEYRNGFLRPRAMESILLFMVIFNSLRLLQAIVMVTDVAQNIVFRQFLFEFGYEMGFTTLGVYLFGIIHALQNSDRIIFDQWISSPFFADILCTSIIVGPYITNTICSLGAGVSAYLGYTDQANTMASALYIVWTGHCIVLSTLTLFAGWRLIRILNTHIKRKEVNKTVIDISKVKTGAQKVKIIAFTSAISLYLYAGVAIVYGLLRIKIITHVPYSILLNILWNGLGIAASFSVSFAVILNPRMKLSLLFSSDSSNDSRSHGMEHESTSRKNEKGNSSNNKGKKIKTYNHNSTNVTVTETGTYDDSAFDTQTFDDHGAYNTMVIDMTSMYTSNVRVSRNNVPMDVAPTLSTAIAMKYSNNSNPLVLNSNDDELIHAYPESIKSSSHLVHKNMQS